MAAMLKTVRGHATDKVIAVGSHPLSGSAEMYVSYILKRTQICLEDQQDIRLFQRAEAAGTTRSALIRRAIDAYLDVPLDADIERFRNAAQAAAGCAPYLSRCE
jgi:predicted transcriptional regulator